MGRVNQQLQQDGPSEQEQEPTQLHHFSHVHPLQRLVLLQQRSPSSPSNTTCNGCTLPCAGTTYACVPCNYALHKSCAQAPREMQHPAHPTPGHTLALSITPSYADGTFSCDACGKRGRSFSFHCARCEFDLHVPCANLAREVRHRSHPHPLALTFRPPYGPSQPFQCDVCRKTSGEAKWLYRCDSCGFDVHLECANNYANLLPQQQQQNPYLAMMVEGNLQEMQAVPELLRAQNEMQGRAMSEMVQFLQQSQGGVPFGFPFQCGVSNPVNPTANNGGAAAMEALMQNFAGMNLNNTGPGVGGGGENPLGAFLAQMGNGGVLGGDPVSATLGQMANGGVGGGGGGGDALNNVLGQMGEGGENPLSAFLAQMGNGGVLGGHPVSATLGQMANGGGGGGNALNNVLGQMGEGGFDFSGNIGGLFF